MESVILVTGGAGYIGTNIIAKLAERKYKIVCLDNFSNSYDFAIKRLMNKYNNISLEQGDMLDDYFMDNLFKKYSFNIVIHMAGKKYVKESFYKTEEYYKNNIIATQKLLDIMDKYNVTRLIFASSITVYGNAVKQPIKETTKHDPLSPYAEMKSEGEKIIKQWCGKNKSAIVLRMSNPVGANLELMLGEHSKSDNLSLLPYLLQNIDKELKFNGNNHPTKDGSTVRDYIHVEDVAYAYADACELNISGFSVFNIGSGEPGYSVLQMLKEAERVLNIKAKYSFGPKREGDASVLITDTSKAKKELNFKINKTLYDMVDSQNQFYHFIKD